MHTCGARDADETCHAGQQQAPGWPQAIFTPAQQLALAGLELCLPLQRRLPQAASAALGACLSALLSRAATLLMSDELCFLVHFLAVWQGCGCLQACWLGAGPPMLEARPPALAAHTHLLNVLLLAQLRNLGAHHLGGLHVAAGAVERGADLRVERGGGRQGAARGVVNHLHTRRRHAVLSAMNRDGCQRRLQGGQVWHAGLPDACHA